MDWTISTCGRNVQKMKHDEMNRNDYICEKNVFIFQQYYTIIWYSYSELMGL